jgi:hypothetical protein
VGKFTDPQHPSRPHPGSLGTAHTIIDHADVLDEITDAIKED